MRNRVPVPNSISITPGGIGNAVTAAASGRASAASGGTSNVSDANRAATCPRSCWRQRNSWLA